MRKILIVIVLFCASLACAHAETIILRTGARVKGTIVFQNEEVVIVRDAEGARFQYPRADVQEILADEVEKNDSAKASESDEVQEITTSKQASILLEIAGGAAVIPSQSAGGAVSVDLLVGSHHIGDKHIFIGGGLGYHGVFLGAEKYNFLPIQVALRMPMIEAKHAPVFGFGLGYGIALSKNYLGGIYAGVDLGYRCQLNPKTAIALVAFANFQQAQVPVTTVIEGIEFTNQSGRNIVSSGLKLALYF
jgi:hypothetical protein